VLRVASNFMITLPGGTKLPRIRKASSPDIFFSGQIGIAADEPPHTLGEFLVVGHAMRPRISAGRSRVLARQRAAAAGRG
jgi:hypothetical protein